MLNPETEEILKSNGITRETVPGWYDMIIFGCEQIDKLQPDIVVLQVKRKFDFLCFYVEDALPEVQEIIDTMTRCALQVCWKHGTNKTKHEFHDYAICSDCKKEEFNER